MSRSTTVTITILVLIAVAGIALPQTAAATFRPPSVHITADGTLTTSPASPPVEPKPAANVNGVVGLYVGQISNTAWWSGCLPQVKAAGMTSIRVILPWSEVETSDDVYSWSNVDKTLTLAANNGLGVEFVLLGTPAWSQSGTASARRGPDDSAKIADFARTLCSRYSGRIAALQIWNEPNATGFFKPYPGATLPQSYVRILQAAYQGAKAGDAAVRIVGGNMDGRFSTDTAAQYYAQDDFTGACYAAGAKGFFDVWATHNYPGTPSSRVPEFKFGSWAGNRTVWGVVDTMRAIMDQNGDQAVPLAISEVGWLAAGSAASFSAAPSQATQRRYTVRHIVHAYAHGIRDYHVMFVRDFTGNAKGVFNSDFTPRPVFTAMVTLNTALTGATYDRRLMVGANNYAFSFEQSDGRQIVVAWTTVGEYVDQSGARATGTTTVNVPLVARATYDKIAMDGATTGTLKAGTSLTLANDPVILIQR